jgi:hypothetical protein
MTRECLPEGELRDRVDLMEVAAEFHQEEMLTWLHRDATVFERELLGVFALGRKLADSLVVALENGFRPWWSRTREVSLKWLASAKMEFVSAPEGFSSEDGWWTAVPGATSVLRGLGSDTRLGSTPRDGALHGRSAVRIVWTRLLFGGRWSDAQLVKSVVFPPGVTAIGERALYEFEALESVVFPAGCIDFGQEAFEGCKALKVVSLPVGCKATGYRAFHLCKSLVGVTIPAGCVTISGKCFELSSSLTEVRFPDGLKLSGDDAFWECALREVTLPDGCQIGAWAFYRCRRLTKVAIGRDCRSITLSAFRECGALTILTIGDGLTSIGEYAFSGCSLLASVTLPSTVQSIGVRAFQQCRSLEMIAVPEGCQLHDSGFWPSCLLVTRF